MSCIEQRNQRDENDDDSIEISDGCQEMYQMAGKCETKMNLDYPVDNACSFVAGLVTLDEHGTPGRRRSRTVTAFTVVFAGTTVAMASYIYFLRASKFTFCRSCFFFCCRFHISPCAPFDSFIRTN